MTMTDHFLSKPVNRSSDKLRMLEILKDKELGTFRLQDSYIMQPHSRKPKQ